MTRNQIRLSDEILARSNKVCEARDISPAELARRGLEYILSVYARVTATNRNWQPPKPRKPGWEGLSDAGLKQEARPTTTELALSRRRRRWDDDLHRYQHPVSPLQRPFSPPSTGSHVAHIRRW